MAQRQELAVAAYVHSQDQERLVALSKTAPIHTTMG